ncbi:hypothetical protein NX059_007577 [Plenodomus lindquistii]|nr:hypothetical protein NX059_007577 [Plenodomus lindquistii]
MQRPPSPSNHRIAASPSLGDRIEALPVELRRMIMAYFLPTPIGRKKFPWTGACPGRVKYDACTTGLAPRAISREICDDFEQEISKALRNKPLIMEMKLDRGTGPHGMSGLLAKLCQPEDGASVQQRGARYCVKTWWGLLLSMLVDLGASRDNRVCSKFGFDSVAATKILEDVKDIVSLGLLHYGNGAPGTWRNQPWGFLRAFLLSAFPQFVTNGVVEVHLTVPDWDAYETRHLYAFLQDARFFTENGLLSLRVLVFTRGATIDEWLKSLPKVAKAVEWVEDMTQV